MNSIVDVLAMFATRTNMFVRANKLNCHVVTLYRPHLPDNDEFWNIFKDDNMILSFLKDEIHEPSRDINLEQNKYPKVLTPLEDTFSSSDASIVGTF